MKTKKIGPTLWKQPAKEQWIRDAIASKQSQELAKTKSASGDGWLKRSKLNHSFDASPSSLKAGSTVGSTDFSPETRNDQVANAPYSIDWSLRSNTALPEMPAHKPLSALVPPVKNDSTYRYVAQPTKPVDVPTSPFRSVKAVSHSPIVDSRNGSQFNAIEARNERLEPLLRPSPLPNVLAIQPFAGQNISGRMQAAKTWSLETQDDDSKPAKRRENSIRTSPLSVHPLLPTQTAFEQRDRNAEVTTLELDLVPSQMTNSDSLHQAPQQPMQEAVKPAIEAASEAAAEDSMAKLEAFLHAVQSERDVAVTSAMENSKLIEEIRNEWKKPLANMLLMTKLLKAMGLTAAQQKVADRLLKSTNWMMTDLYGMLAPDSSTANTSKSNVAPIPSIPTIPTRQTELKESA